LNLLRAACCFYVGFALICVIRQQFAGGVLSSPNFRQDVLDEFFVEHCPKQCTNNPPPPEVIGYRTGASRSCYRDCRHRRGGGLSFIALQSVRFWYKADTHVRRAHVRL
jgi:hypothetical protein